MANFTPGPWEPVELNEGEALIVQPCDTSKQPICLVDRVPNAWDNANLIAAAPSLYTALKAIIGHTNFAGCVQNGTVAQDAIAQAEGKDQSNV